jgi:hypothetical protein
MESYHIIRAELRPPGRALIPLLYTLFFHRTGNFEYKNQGFFMQLGRDFGDDFTSPSCALLVYKMELIVKPISGQK